MYSQQQWYSSSSSSVSEYVLDYILVRDSCFFKAFKTTLESHVNKWKAFVKTLSFQGGLEAFKAFGVLYHMYLYSFLWWLKNRVVVVKYSTSQLRKYYLPWWRDWAQKVKLLFMMKQVIVSDTYINGVQFCGEFTSFWIFNCSQQNTKIKRNAEKCLLMHSSFHLLCHNKHQSEWSVKLCMWIAANITTTTNVLTAQPAQFLAAGRWPHP